jgi:hypothetical protein
MAWSAKFPWHIFSKHNHTGTPLVTSAEACTVNDKHTVPSPLPLLRLSAGGSAAAGPKLAGNKLKIKFKPAQVPPAAASEPPADRSSQVQGAPAAVPGAGAAGQQLQRQLSANPSQVTAASTGQSQRASLVKTKIKFLPKGPRPGAASGGPAAAPGVGTPAAVAAATPSPAGAAAVAGQATPRGAFVQPTPPSMPSWDAGGYSQPAAHRPQPLRPSSGGGGARQAAAATAARVTASNSKAAEAKQRRAARERELQLKREAEAAADAARGPPPPPSRSSRLPAWALGEVLTLWELCQCFAAALQVRPCVLG